MRNPIWALGVCVLMHGAATAINAVEPGDVIINEVYFNLLEKPAPGHYEAVELLVVHDHSDINGMQISDRDIWNKPSEYQCTLQDMGKHFLSDVRSGTLIVIYDGTGEDDIDASDFVLRLFAQSSLFCNLAPATNAFRIADQGDNLHLLHLGKQVDFLKYVSTRSPRNSGNPGLLSWENGMDGAIQTGVMDQNVGFRFHGDKPELNDYPAAWLPYSEPTTQSNNLGEPNGGRNSQWIETLRKSNSPESKAPTSLQK